jgi:hypothetical protein
MLTVLSGVILEGRELLSVKKFLISLISSLVTLLVSTNEITPAGVNFRGCF